MAYTWRNFKTKKELKSEVERYNNHGRDFDGCYGEVKCYNPGLGPDLSNYTGKVWLEGPHYSKAHTWHAEAELKDGVVIKVK